VWVGVSGSKIRRRRADVRQQALTYNTDLQFRLGARRTTLPDPMARFMIAGLWKSPGKESRFDGRIDDTESRYKSP
jgi:hypothetical protein